MHLTKIEIEQKVFSHVKLVSSSHADSFAFVSSNFDIGDLKAGKWNFVCAAHSNICLANQTPLLLLMKTTSFSNNVERNLKYLITFLSMHVHKTSQTDGRW